MDIRTRLNINIAPARVMAGMLPGIPRSHCLWGLQVKGIPFLAFDAGGVLELFDHHEYPDNIVWDPTAEGLSQRIAEVRAPGCAEYADTWQGMVLESRVLPRWREDGDLTWSQLLPLVLDHIRPPQPLTPYISKQMSLLIRLLLFSCNQHRSLSQRIAKVRLVCTAAACSDDGLLLAL